MPTAVEAADTPRDPHARALGDIQMRVEELQAILWPLQFQDPDNPLVDSRHARLKGAASFRLQSAADDARALYEAVEPETGGLTDGRPTTLACRACALLAAVAPALEEMAGRTDVGVVKLMYFYDATTELLEDLDRWLESESEEADRYALWLASALRELYLTAVGEHEDKMDVIRDWLRENDVPARISEPVLARLDRRWKHAT